MNWWSLFRTARKIVFVLIVITSLLWAVALAVYLSKQWNHFDIMQRAIVLSMIGVNGVTSLLLYLMVVVVFRMWKELLRVIFLLAIHATTAIIFTLYGFGFSCGIFDTQTTCKIVDVIFLSTAWVLTGLLFGYTVYLCIMSRVPRPFPVVIPNDLLTSFTPSLSRSSSLSSVNSATGLVRKDTIPAVRPGSAQSTGAVYSSQQHPASRTVPKRLFVANNTQSTDVSSAGPRDQQLRRERSYGAVGSMQRPAEVEKSVLRSRFSDSSITSARSVTIRPAPPPQFIMANTLRRMKSVASTIMPAKVEQATQRFSSRPFLLNPDPFQDPLLRLGTPETPRSYVSTSSAPGNLNLGHVTAYSPFVQGYGNYLTPYSTPSAEIPAQLRPGPHADNPFQSPGANVPPHTQMAPYLTYSGSTSDAPSRSHASTPSGQSIHSLVPSLHLVDGYGQPIHAAAPYIPATAAFPAPAHLNYHTSNLLWSGRRYSAGARLGDDIDVELPNPYNRGAEIRRYGSVPHVRSGSYAREDSAGAGPMGNANAWASPLSDMPYAHVPNQGYARVHQRGIARAVAAVNDPGWREMVMKAATAP